MNVELVPAQPADAGRLAALYASERTFLAPFEPVRSPAFFGEPAQRERLRELDVLRRAGAAFAFLIVADGELAGTLTVSNVVRGAFRSANLGYFVSEHLNGRGIATQAVGFACRTAFGELGLHRLEAATLLGNGASQRVLRRNAFRTIGVARAYLEIDGRFQDHVLLARIAGDERPAPFPPGDVRVRPAGLGDARALALLLRAVAAEPGAVLAAPGASGTRVERHLLRSLVRDGGAAVLVAERNGLLHGRLDLRRDAHPNAPHLAELGIVVAPGVRRQGVGTALVHGALRWCRERGVQRLEAHVLPDNARSLEFLRRHGFEEQGLRRARFLESDAPRDAVLLARSVDAEV